MLNRRNMLKLGGTAALLAPYAGFRSAAFAQSGPRFRFGIIADPQYAPVAPKGTRYYANSLWKLSDAIETLNKENDLRFVATLGDIIDRNWESYSHILPLYDKLKHERFFLLGNHDYEVAADYLGSVLRNIGMRKAYYDFAGGGYRFIVIDGNDVSVFAPPKDDPRREIAAERLASLTAKNAVNAQSWNGSLSDEQFAWLQDVLKKAQASDEKIIVMGHYPIYPLNEHNLWDSERIVDLLTSHPNFVAYFNGHNHAGNFGEIAGKYFVNFRGMVETPTTTAFSIVEVFDNKIDIKGFGREESRSLKI